jgi:hypothetical protein
VKPKQLFQMLVVALVVVGGYEVYKRKSGK